MPSRTLRGSQHHTPEVEEYSDSNQDSEHLEDGKSKVPPNSVRKAQNRIAQREFRQRKQQYIRDLEARLHAHETNEEESSKIRGVIVKNLLKENKELRDLIKSLSAFIGEGIGSCLPRLGLSATQLDQIINRSETETAYEAFASVAVTKEKERENPGSETGSSIRNSTVSTKRKRRPSNLGGESGLDSHESTRPATPIIIGPSNGQVQEGIQGMKTAQPEGENEFDTFTSYDHLFPESSTFSNINYPSSSIAGPSSIGWPNLYQVPLLPKTPTQQQSLQNGMLYRPVHLSPQQAIFQSFGSNISDDQLDTSGDDGIGMMSLQSNGFATYQQPGFGLTVPGTSTNAPQVIAHFPLPDINGASRGLATREVERQKRLRNTISRFIAQEIRKSVPGSMTPEEIAQTSKLSEELTENFVEGRLPDSDRKIQAAQLITYHLTNFRVNQSYTLPPSLRPSNVQKTIPHEYAIDGIIFPSIRDRMILLRGQYDLVDAFQDFLNEFSLHGQDVLDHNNWEVSEKWLNTYKMLCDAEVYDITNRWRVSRGAQPLINPGFATNVPGQNQNGWG